jgi:Protein of unknown function (DUF3761)
MRRGMPGLAICLVQIAAATQANAFACNNNRYINSAGQGVHSPSCGTESDHKTADCRDGSVSHSDHHRGPCSHHGGVAHWDRRRAAGNEVPKPP